MFTIKNQKSTSSILVISIFLATSSVTDMLGSYKSLMSFVSKSLKNSPVSIASQKYSELKNQSRVLGATTKKSVDSQKNLKKIK